MQKKYGHAPTHKHHYHHHHRRRHTTYIPRSYPLVCMLHCASVTTRRADHQLTLVPHALAHADDRGMGVGRGVFFSFQVRFMGTVEVKTSLRSFSVEDQTSIAREALNMVRAVFLSLLSKHLCSNSKYLPCASFRLKFSF